MYTCEAYDINICNLQILGYLNESSLKLFFDLYLYDLHGINIWLSNFIHLQCQFLPCSKSTRNKNVLGNVWQCADNIQTIAVLIFVCTIVR